MAYLGKPRACSFFESEMNNEKNDHKKKDLQAWSQIFVFLI